MPQSLSSVYLHLVFSTRERRAYLQDPQLRAEMHAYLGGISKKLDCPPLIVGGVEDHVHLLARFGRSLSQSEWVKELKRSSSIWIKEHDLSMGDFAWQSGYGTFSVSRSQVDRVTEYIQTQEEHHHHIGFQDEFRKLLQKHEIEYDERYVWD